MCSQRVLRPKQDCVACLFKKKKKIPRGCSCHTEFTWTWIFFLDILEAGPPSTCFFGCDNNILIIVANILTCCSSLHCNQHPLFWFIYLFILIFVSQYKIRLFGFYHYLTVFIIHTDRRCLDAGGFRYRTRADIRICSCSLSPLISNCSDIISWMQCSGERTKERKKRQVLFIFLSKVGKNKTRKSVPN